jgi:hypothetical protein
LVFGTGGPERARIDSSGRLLVGTSTARTDFFNETIGSNLLQVERSNNGGDATISLVSNPGTPAEACAGVILGRTRATTAGGNTLVADGDYLGYVSFQGADGAGLIEGAKIRAEVDGTPGADDLPSRLMFFTAANGAATPTERMRITSDAYVRLASGTGGIQFNGDTAAANALDDYEEGTWTPNQGAGLTVVGTFSSVGRYIKVGNLVFVSGYVSGLTSVAVAAGSILCSNLPFTQQTVDGAGGNCTNYNINETAGLFATNNSTNLYATSALTASQSIIFGFTYRV